MANEKYILIEVKEHPQLSFLYNDSALTFEGVNDTKENYEYLVNWLEEQGAEPVSELPIYKISGKMMNEEYGLTGDNAYQDDLNIVSVPLKALGNYMAIVFSRFAIGGRWFDDIVENNRIREEEK